MSSLTSVKKRHEIFRMFVNVVIVDSFPPY